MQSLHLHIASTVFLLSSMVSFVQHYQQKNLISNVSDKATTPDSRLKNAWGLAAGPSTFWCVARNGDGSAITYDGEGNLGPASVMIPAAPGHSGLSTPTGIVFNGSRDFELAPGQPALFVFVTEDGTISGWNPNVDPRIGVLNVNDSPDAVYKGVTISEFNGHRFLYVANFRSGHIEVYDSNFHRAYLLQHDFADDRIPHDFAPFNIQAIGRNLYVMYAKQDSERHAGVAGSGNGFVDVFNPEGRLLARLQHGPWFNSPWGATMTPGNFGELSHAILVGNFGSGTIAAFNPLTGQFIGNIRNAMGGPLTIDGLWALQFGNNTQAGSALTMFFTAGPSKKQNGLFGTLTPIPSELNEDNEP